MTASPSDFNTAYQAIQDAVSTLNDRVGSAQGNAQAVTDAMGILAGIASSATGAVKASAGVLTAKGKALLDIQTRAVAEASGLLTQESQIEAQIQDPLYSFLSTDPGNWGSRQQQLLTALFQSVQTLLAQINASVVRVNQENADMVQYQKETMQLQGAAAGTGALPTVMSWLGGTASALTSGLSSVIWPVAIVGGVALVAWLYSIGSFGLKKAAQ